MSNMKVPTDPKKWGAIVWYNIHSIAIEIKSQDEIKFFIKTLRIICARITCPKCREHARQFLVSNPPEKYIENYPEKCFKYTVDFHNHANKITGQPLMDYDTARELYDNFDNDGICTESCNGPIDAVSSVSTTPIGPSAATIGKVFQPKSPTTVYVPTPIKILSRESYVPVKNINDLIRVPKQHHQRRELEEIRIPQFDDDNVTKVKRYKH